MKEIKELSHPLEIEHIDFRVQSINKGGYATILAYKNARVDMQRLDDVCGPGEWQRDHKEIKSNVYCGIGIKCENGWIWKWDAGAESYSDKEKGEASDSFKRAGFNWGIGRELYNYPIIQVKLKNTEFTMQNDRAKQTWELKLKDWEWNIIWLDDEVGALVAFDQYKEARYLYSIDEKSLEKLWNLYPEKQKEKTFVNYVKQAKDKLK